MNIKNLTKKQKIIINVSLMIIAILVLVIAVFSLVKTINKQKAIETAKVEEERRQEEANLLEQQELADKSEISIEDLTEEQEENTAKKENSKSEATTSSGYKYYIKVNYGANTVTIYTKDSDGKYTVPYKAMICSTGTATPKSGVYTIKGRWRWLGLIGGVYGQYSTQIVGNILFHSVPYLDKSQDSLEYWEYDKLGTSCSAGCIRLTVRDAMWIYNNIPSGTSVEFYSSSNPGPLRKTISTKNIRK